jgi:hypothetical protein
MALVANVQIQRLLMDDANVNDHRTTDLMGQVAFG